MSRFLDNWGPTIVAAGGVTVVAVAGAVLTELGPWYYGLKKPSWQPPDWLFGPAWTTIFILEAAAGVITWHATPDAGAAGLLIGSFALNGLLNIIWSVLFFKMYRPDYSLREVGFLWLSILGMMIVVGFYAGWAWILLLPYLLWVSFASFLNFTIVRLNAPFAGRVK
jgi:tryptophan-rich sensory protein